jgi:hypothetical protein
MGRHTMTMSPIGSVLRAAADLQRAVKMLLVAAFSLLCAVCTEASADCRDEVAAAFERLRTSGRPYRKEVTFVVSDQQTFHQTAEFVPPDRMREITNDGVPGHGTGETIRVGPRIWSNPLTFLGFPLPWGWREVDPWLAQDIFKAGMDISVLPDRAVPANAVFECLGMVEFKGTAYIGYRARLDKVIMSLRLTGPLSETEQQELSSKLQHMPKEWSETKQQELSSKLQHIQQELSTKLQHMPKEWRTVFVNPQSKLPVHDLVTPENQLDDPRRRVQYTYPSDIKIERPVWCWVGLCPVAW